MAVSLALEGLSEIRAFEQFAGDPLLEALARRLAREVREDARERIDSGNEAPGGARWKAWAETYAPTRVAGDKLLKQGRTTSGKLLDAIAVREESGGADVVIVGRPDGEYHQRTRPFVGFSRGLRRKMNRELPDEAEARWALG